MIDALEDKITLKNCLKKVWLYLHVY